MASPASPIRSPSDAAARDRSELAWLDAVRTGDEAAFESLFRAYFEPLCAFAYTYVESQETAQELIQDLFAKLWQRRETLELPRNVHAYLYGATRNAAISALRTRRVEREFLARAVREEQSGAGGPAQFAPAAEAEFDARALADALERAVQEMPLRCREVFTLTRDQKLSYAQAAQVLGISPKTVEIHMGRALALLRRKLGPWLPGSTSA